MGFLQDLRDAKTDRMIRRADRIQDAADARTAADREGAATALVMSDPTARLAVGMNPGSEQSQGLLTGLASPDPAARGTAGAAFSGLSGAPDMMFQRNARQLQEYSALRQLEQNALYGGLTADTWNSQYVRLTDMGFGMQNIEDLRSLNRHYGREAMPGEIRGAYGALRGQVLNSLRVMFEAGALQKAELDFFESMLPDFGIWQTATENERDQRLRILQEGFARKAGVLSAITPNTSVPQVLTRDAASILGEPPPPPGTAALNPRTEGRQGPPPADEAEAAFGEFLNSGGLMP